MELVCVKQGWFSDKNHKIIYAGEIMSIKKDVLAMLEKHRGNYFSGEELAEQLGVSRTAVWKAVRALEQEGYEILAGKNKGYCLPKESDLLSKEGICNYLPEEYKDLPLFVYRETDSTNTLAKQAANTGQQAPAVYVAAMQTAGRGRRGRSFVSVPGGNICMSFLLKPKLAATDAVFLTTATCVAVHRAIRKATGIICEIKWVNDLYYRGKKVCGILTEAVTDCETGMVDCVIPGIGINFNIMPEQFPEELKEIAGALYTGDKRIDVTRNYLAAEIIVQMFKILTELPEKSFVGEYREHSMLLGKKIYIYAGDRAEKATAVGIDENGGLVVELEGGERRVLTTGEVTVRVTE